MLFSQITYTLSITMLTKKYNLCVALMQNNIYLPTHYLIEYFD